MFAIEVLIYTTPKTSTRTFFISKADSSGYLPSSLASFMTAQGGRQSTLRTIATAFIRHLFDEFRKADPTITATISLFARSQTQYLFPNSAQNDKKHVLTDRGLISWWCKVLDPILQEHSSTPTGAKGYLLVPGFDLTDTRQFFPPSTTPTHIKWVQGHPYKLDPGADITVREVIPHFPDDPKARFLDELGSDEKEKTGKVIARGQGWRNCRTIEQFWELMSFRQECSLGRCVGFLWIVLEGGGKFKAEKSERKIKAIRKKIPSPTPENSELKPTVGEKEKPEKTILETPENSQLPPPPEPKSELEEEPEKPVPTSTNSQVGPLPITTTSNLPTSEPATTTPPPISRSPSTSPRKSNKRPSSSIQPGSPQKKMRTVNPIPPVSDSPVQPLLLLDEKVYQRVSDSLLNHADFGDKENAKRGSAKWLEGAAIAAGKGGKGDWGVEIKGKLTTEEGNGSGSVKSVPIVNLLTVRKKPKPSETVPMEKEKDKQGREVNVLPASLFRKKPKAADAAEIKPSKGVTEKLKTTEEAREEVDRQGRVVNVLDAALMRKKAKPQEV